MTTPSKQELGSKTFPSFAHSPDPVVLFDPKPPNPDPCCCCVLLFWPKPPNPPNDILGDGHTDTLRFRLVFWYCSGLMAT